MKKIRLKKYNPNNYGSIPVYEFIMKSTRIRYYKCDKFSYGSKEVNHVLGYKCTYLTNNSHNNLYYIFKYIDIKIGELIANAIEGN